MLDYTVWLQLYRSKWKIKQLMHQSHLRKLWWLWLVLNLLELISFLSAIFFHKDCIRLRPLSQIFCFTIIAIFLMSYYFYFTSSLFATWLYSCVRKKLYKSDSKMESSTRRTFSRTKNRLQYNLLPRRFKKRYMFWYCELYYKQHNTLQPDRLYHVCDKCVCGKLWRNRTRKHSNDPNGFRR